MAELEVNTPGFDSYQNFRFRVKWEGKYVAGFNRLSALAKSTQSVTHREGSNKGTFRNYHGNWKFEPVTLERGLTRDKDFADWANQMASSGTNAAISLENLQKDILIELVDEQGKVTREYRVFRSWVSAFHALPDLDAGGNSQAIESMVLQNEGWEQN